jgi:hypothetical protein
MGMTVSLLTSYSGNAAAKFAKRLRFG